MRQRGGSEQPVKGRRATRSKARNLLTVAPSIADLQKHVSALTLELREAREQQTATADVLKVISRSAFDLQAVLQTLVESAARLCDADMAQITRQRDGVFFRAEAYGFPEQFIEYSRTIPVAADRGSAIGRALLEGTAIHIPDALADPEYTFTEGQRLADFRAVLAVPLLRDGAPIGVIVMTRKEARPFTQKQIELATTFADQAVIAIENVRLFDEVRTTTRELTEALTYQTGSANILKVIASSPTDVGPVLTAIVESACVICEAQEAHVTLKDGDELLFQAQHGSVPVPWKRQPINRRWVTGRAAVDRRPIHVHDLLSSEGDEFPDGRELARQDGSRTVLAVPLLREGGCVGVIVLRRMDVRPFSEKQIELLQTFADQAVIAIENARLFNETKEALERQTATAEVLRVIASSPSDLQPVFEAIATRSTQLVGGHSAAVSIFVGDMVHLGAFTPVSPEADAALKALYPRRLADYPLFELARDGEVAQVSDIETDTRVPSVAKATARARGFRSLLLVPMNSDTGPIGVITVTRKEPGTFAALHIQLLQTFADQAVIAIKNVQLFEEVQARTTELTESLEQQTATSEVLQVISSSPGELEPVFQKMLENGTRVCGANFGTMTLYEGDSFRTVALYNAPNEAFAASRMNRVMRPHPRSALGELARTKQIVRVDDLRTQPPYLEGDPAVVELSDVAGARTAVVVPMLREKDLVGTITIYRREVKPFTEKQIDLVANFAKQAVIAIENTRLLKELRQRTDDLTESLEQQTATSEVLQVISSSQGKLEPVFQKMLEKATHVCGANFGTMNLWDGESVNIAASYNVPPAFTAWRQRTPIRPHPESGLAIVIRTHHAAHVHDLRYGPAYLAGDPANVAMVEIAGARTIVTVPMLKEDKLIGTMSIFRQEVRPFTDKQIALVENFTKQAVIAIENTRLLNELRERTNELSQSLDELRAAQDRLIQTEKLASLGQLTAGIAHEIKNPLNFVNNFSALSTELVDEMNDVLKDTMLDQKPREQLEELTQILKSNLEKVVQHGRRADSIVKNMLLHSRQGIGEHRSAAVNAIVEESLNLAYHGARAEKSGFKITLQRYLDPGAGVVEVYPQEITRALLNLISNGFYAATKRKSEANDKTFEPVLSAATKNLGNRVEIRIRDNGVGIPPDVKEKIFNPFFTTKPAGEGTGLGLSISHDIIVKQHGGTIDVDTEPGVFTEFIITLPRNAAAPIQTGSRNDR